MSVALAPSAKTAERSVLHVLPHRGAGGEVYVDTLRAIPGWRFEIATLSERQSPLAAAARVPGVARAARRHDLVHLHGDAVAALCLPVARRRPAVITFNGLHLWRRLGSPARAALQVALRAAMRGAGVTICVSESELEAASQIAPGADLELIHNGIEVHDPPTAEERAEARAELGIEPGEVAVLFAGTLDERKNPELFALAVEIARRGGAPVVGLIAGDGPLRGTLERDGVRELGYRSDLRRVIAACDAYCATSKREGLSLALLEAMAAGLAPLVSDGPGNPEAVGDAGILVPLARQGEEALAGELERLARHPEVARDLGERARERVRERFDAAMMVERTAAVYDRVVRSGSGAEPPSRGRSGPGS